MKDATAGSSGDNATSTSHSLRKRWLFWGFFAALALFSGIADITHFQSLPNEFIGHGDQANTASVARNIAEGRGAVTDSIGFMTNGGIKGNDLPQPESYWSIYVAFVISIFFRLFTDNLAALLLPAVLAKVAIAALATVVVIRLSGSLLAAAAAAAFLLLHPAMTAFVNGLSDIYLTLCVLVACMLLVSAIRTRSWLKFLALGVVIGIAIGVKPSGGLLIGLLGSGLALTGDMLKSAKWACISAAGILLGLVPLLHHNYTYFGGLASPTYALVAEAGRITYLTGDHNRGLFDPEPYPATAEANAGLKSRLSQSISYLIVFLRTFHAGDIVPAWQLPFAFLAVLLFLLQLRSLSFFQNGSYEVQFCTVVVLMLAAGFVLGLAIHTEVRYWNFLVPLMTIMAVCMMARLHRLLPVFVIATSVFSFMQVQRYYAPTPIPQGMALARSKLPANAVVLTPDPWEFAFHTRRRSVVLPYTSKPEILRSVSERYRALYVVIVDGNIRNDFYKPLLEGNPPPYLQPIYRDKRLLIAKFNWP